MSVSIKVPDLGATDDNVTLLRWLVDEGAEIVRGQKIAAIETDKAVVELESAAAGVLLRKCIADGDDAMVGDVIAYVGKPGESVSECDDAPVPANKMAGETDASPPLVKAAAREDLRREVKPQVSPVVRNLAKQKNVDLDQVVGTGPGGVITRQDILSAVKRGGD